MKNTELEHEVNEFREKVARVTDAGNAERVFRERVKIPSSARSLPISAI